MRFFLRSCSAWRLIDHHFSTLSQWQGCPDIFHLNLILFHATLHSVNIMFLANFPLRDQNTSISQLLNVNFSILERWCNFSKNYEGGNELFKSGVPRKFFKNVWNFILSWNLKISRYSKFRFMVKNVCVHEIVKSWLQGFL